MENALQAANHQPLIIVSLDRRDDAFIIKVKDNGPGFTCAIREKMFDPFFSTKVDGNGLGLAVVMSAAKAHGGEACASNRDDGGAVIELTLPIETNQSR